MSKPSKGIIPQAISVVSFYVLWLITGGLGVLDLLVARIVLREVYFALRLSHWSWGAVHNFGVLILAIIWLILFLVCEYWYRGAAALSLSRLLRRFGVVTGAQVGFLALAGITLFSI